ncbi:MAG: terminase family protein, partial [Actinobacteria bacterium]|nr:terminase family protein [Actinomycetota bacterium]
MNTPRPVLGRSSATQAVGRPNLDIGGVRVASVRKLTGLHPVYNLEVEGEHEYFANGFLAHNCSWRYLQETWDMAMFGFRLGQNPKHIITTTPRPLKILKDLIRDAVPASEMEPDSHAEVVITRGTTMDNRDNLAPNFIDVLVKKYSGTRLGRQELYAEILDDNPNALFSQQRIEENRVIWLAGSVKRGSTAHFEFIMGQGAERSNTFKAEIKEVVVAVDPSMSNDLESDETGIIVAALDAKDN